MALLQLGPLAVVQFAAFRHGQGRVVDLLLADQARNGRGDRRIAEDRPQRQPGDAVVLLGVRAVGELSPLKSELLAKGLMPNQPTSSFFMAAQSPDSSVTTLVFAV